MDLIFLVGVGVIGYFIFKGLKKHSSLPTFDDYRSAHPELVKDGKISCYKCEGSDVSIRQIGKTPTSILNHHVCKTCGTTLFRSST